jgi:hypothetical protein
MTYERFLKVILSLQKEHRVTQILYDNGMHVINFVDPYHRIISELIKEFYGEDGHDWWSWYCYENDFGTKQLEAKDEEGNQICYSHETLWEYLEKNRVKKVLKYINKIDDILASYEDWMHGENAEECMKARKYLTEIIKHIR